MLTITNNFDVYGLQTDTRENVSNRLVENIMGIVGTFLKCEQFGVVVKGKYCCMEINAIGYGDRIAYDSFYTEQEDELIDSIKHWVKTSVVEYYMEDKEVDGVYKVQVMTKYDGDMGSFQIDIELEQCQRIEPQKYRLVCCPLTIEKV